MSSLPELKPGWRSHNMLVGRYRFARGPKGLRESELQNDLTKYFQTKMQVKAAYFATIKYTSGTFTGPALCLKTSFGGETMDLVEAAGEIFARWFVLPERMDVTFLTDEQEMKLEKVCTPFYTRPGHNADLYADGLPLTGLVCPHCISGKSRILHAFRTAPCAKNDSGWQFFCKCGMPEDPAAIKTLPLKEIIKLEPTLRGWLETPIGMNLWRATGKSRWEQIKEGTNGNEHNGHYSNGQNGNGHHLPNGDISFVRETGKPFDREMFPPAESKPDDGDPIREYIKLRLGWPHPIEIALYYECLACGEILSSASAGEAKCRCGTIAIKSGIVTIQNLGKASAFRQR
jgi:hypothetical protein